MTKCRTMVFQNEREVSSPDRGPRSRKRAHGGSLYQGQLPASSCRSHPQAVHCIYPVVSRCDCIIRNNDVPSTRSELHCCPI